MLGGGGWQKDDLGHRLQTAWEMMVGDTQAVTSLSYHIKKYRCQVRGALGLSITRWMILIRW